MKIWKKLDCIYNESKQKTKNCTMTNIEFEQQKYKKKDLFFLHYIRFDNQHSEKLVFRWLESFKIHTAVFRRKLSFCRNSMTRDFQKSFSTINWRFFESENSHSQHLFFLTQIFGSQKAKCQMIECK